MMRKPQSDIWEKLTPIDLEVLRGNFKGDGEMKDMESAKPFRDHFFYIVGVEFKVVGKTTHQKINK